MNNSPSFFLSLEVWNFKFCSVSYGLHQDVNLLILVRDTFSAKRLSLSLGKKEFTLKPSLMSTKYT